MSQRTRSRTKRATRGGSQGGDSRPTTNKNSLAELLNWFLPDNAIFANVKFHGNTTWSPRHVVFLAVCWAWSNSSNVTDAFQDAVKWSGRLWGSSPFTSYTGFMGAMTKWHFTFIELLGPVLHARMQEVGGQFWQFLKWVPIAFDGSRATASRTKSNEKAFCAPNYGGSRTAEYRRRKLQNARRGKKAKAVKRRARTATAAARIKAAQAALQKKSECPLRPQGPESAPR